MIPITDEDLAALPIPTAKTIEIEGFVPAESIDPLQVDAAYYLAANGVPAAKPYTLLREALKRSGKVAICKFALRGRERLGMLRVVDDVLAMHGLLWPDEIRTTDGVAPDASVTVRDKELDLADALMDTLGEVDLDSLHDDYREAVEELIAAKASGEEPAAAPAPAPGGKVLDLMAALEKSVRDAKESRGEDVADITPSRPAPPPNSPRARNRPPRPGRRPPPRRSRRRSRLSRRRRQRRRRQRPRGRRRRRPRRRRPRRRSPQQQSPQRRRPRQRRPRQRRPPRRRPRRRRRHPANAQPDHTRTLSLTNPRFAAQRPGLRGAP